MVELDYSSVYDSKFEIYTAGTWSTKKRDIDPTQLNKALSRRILSK